MKKVILFALVILASASFSPAMAEKKNKKKKTTAQPVEAVVLATPSDTVSYAVGKASTRGLMNYLKQEYGVDTAYMANFVQGYNEALQRMNDPEYKAYNAGVQIARMAAERILPGAKADFENTKDSIAARPFHQGFLAGVTDDNTFFAQSEAESFYEARRTADIEARNAAYKAENERWLADNKTKEGVKTTASGLQYKVISAGNGAIPKATDKVTVKYEGKLIDGTVFDSSYKRNPQTSSFRCDQVIKGWTEALTMMPTGSKWELYIPQELAYGSRQAGQIKPYSALVFTVELVNIEQEKPAEAPAKADKSQAEAPAKKTASRRQR